MFLLFSSRGERRKFGGSYFIELQDCRWPREAGAAAVLSADVVKPWQDDSPSVCGDDENNFWLHDGKIFTGGVYPNGQSGAADLWGVHYYSRERVLPMEERVREQPPGCRLLPEWLKKGREDNGLYLLGL